MYEPSAILLAKYCEISKGLQMFQYVEEKENKALPSQQLFPGEVKFAMTFEHHVLVELKHSAVPPDMVLSATVGTTHDLFPMGTLC